ETYESVGKALGVFDKSDVEGSRVRVFVNGDLPLKFECKIGFANGDVVKVTIQYEDLYRHCYSCKRLSHEEGTCPELNEDQRERNRLARIEQKEKEERATKEAFSIPQRQTPGAYIDFYRRESRGGEIRPTYQRSPNFRRENRREEENEHDLHKQLKERREVHSKNVWNRLDSGQYSELPRNRDRYHPYQHSSGAISKERTRDTASSSEWRPKRPQGDRYDKQPARPWNQTNTSSRSRRSPDSQRTISDNPRRQSSHAHTRGRNSRFPPSGTLEWRPVNKHRETGAPRGLLKKDDNPVNLIQLSENDDAEKSASRRSNTEVYDHVRDKQTNIYLDDTGKERENEVDTNMNVDKEPLIDTRANGLKHRSTHGREKEDRELEDEIDEYTKLADLADLDMTEDMVNQDDLLDDMELLKEHTRDDEMEDGRIEAISQLSPERQRTKTQMAIGKKTANHEVERGEIVEKGETVEQVKQDPKNKASAQQTSTLGKKRGARSPDLKGAASIQELPAARWRCQTDASWTNERDRAGMGFVLLEDDIPILFGTQGLSVAVSPLHAEAEGLLWAMQEVMRHGTRAVRFESDCEQLIKLIRDDEDWPSMATELDEIKDLSAEFIEFSIAYVPRSANIRADSLTKGKRSRVFGSPFVNCFAPSWLALNAGQEAAN
ncbi:hypothetical protein IGI04_034784, partial [Brassica rapa subsp. trilocularis]